MIDPKELRLRNLVTDEFYDSFKNVIVVDSVNDKGINLSVEHSDDFPEMQSHWIEPYYTFERLHGIHLTEEWVDKFKWQHNVFWLNLSKDGGGHFIWVSGYKVYIKYVHDFQNIHHALTGQELTIKVL